MEVSLELERDGGLMEITHCIQEMFVYCYGGFICLEISRDK